MMHDLGRKLSDKRQDAINRVVTLKRQLSDVIDKMQNNNYSVTVRRRRSSVHMSEIRGLVHQVLRKRRGQRYDLRKADEEHRNRNRFMCQTDTTKTAATTTCRQTPNTSCITLSEK